VRASCSKKNAEFARARGFSLRTLNLACHRWSRLRDKAIRKTGATCHMAVSPGGDEISVNRAIVATDLCADRRGPTAAKAMLIADSAAGTH
jgi:hypothetical protein